MKFGKRLGSEAARRSGRIDSDECVMSECQPFTHQTRSLMSSQFLPWPMQMASLLHGLQGSEAGNPD